MIRPATHPTTNGRPHVGGAADPPATRPPGRPWTLRELASWLSCSERHIAALVAAGKIASIKVGARRLVPDVEVQRLGREGTG